MQDAREKSRCERIFGIVPPENGATTLYRDNRLCFSDILLTGFDFDLLLLFILTFALWERFIGHTGISLVLSYAIDQIIVKIYGTLFSKNVSKKAIINDRFLL